ncbi:hypothetical protein [Bradymonas sediminis]|nr:hypothetical protein [Bradymonas sediminis]
MNTTSTAQMKNLPDLGKEGYRFVAGEPVIQPFIEVFEPHYFSSPIQMFAKALINTPIEFGTVSGLIANEPEHHEMKHLNHPAGQTSAGFEIPLVMHPHYGAMVCDAIWASGGEELHESLEATIHNAREQRNLLSDILSDSHHLRDQEVSMGIFIMLMRAEAEQVPKDMDLDGVWLCGASNFSMIVPKICDAMAAHEHKRPRNRSNPHDLEFCNYGPRFIASIRSLTRGGAATYTSGLEVLLHFDEI